MEFTAPQDVAVVATAKVQEGTTPNLHLLALHVAPRLVLGGDLGHAHVVKGRVTGLLSPDGQTHEADEDEQHGDQQSDALTPVPDHAPEGEAQADRDYQDGQYLQHVGDGRRVLERMGGVGVEEAHHRWCPVP